MHNGKKMATLAVHAGRHVAREHNAINPSITTSSSFAQEELGGEGGEYFYSRCGNPTRNAYEAALCDLEGGVYATATASGMAAVSLVLEMLPKDANVMAMKGCYGGTSRIFERLRKRTSGLSVTYADLTDLSEVSTLMQRVPFDLLWIETPTNPLLTLVDIPKVASLAASHNILTCLDNTFATAWNQRPLSLGVDIVMLSTSKYIGGHSDLIGGALVTCNDKIAAELDATKTIVGAIASPFDCYLALRGLKTLDLRMERQCSNALKVAEALFGHKKILEVHYPGLPTHPQHDLCKRQMKSGGAVVTIRLNTDMAGTKRFISSRSLFILAESLGGVESMVNHSASMSHGSLTREDCAAMGIHDSTLRLSVGAEDPTDLVADLERALESI
eukprot:TRINITY_DN30401_c0_g1_i1.p1 TRINITY_DN30401_c0_g1~~TRINITY_DN30401_c0_g1_i1.p1  ORF type:complete len:403 (+),score=98.72 TRINITY_DN30401_c0_g1_i1:47-1210(+)